MKNAAPCKRITALVALKANKVDATLAYVAAFSLLAFFCGIILSGPPTEPPNSDMASCRVSIEAELIWLLISLVYLIGVIAFNVNCLVVGIGQILPKIIFYINLPTSGWGSNSSTSLLVTFLPIYMIMNAVIVLSGLVRWCRLKPNPINP